jgi:GH25 family lysozyme M1 (1,4-beta-N-acetylmuramidase)
VCAKSSTLVKGVDVSKWQASIDWSQVKAAGYDFAFVRASDGLNYPDGMFDANWKGTKANGILRGVYQFFRPSQDPIAQADLMLAKLSAAGWMEAAISPAGSTSRSPRQSNTAIRMPHRAGSATCTKTGKNPIAHVGARSGAPAPPIDFPV